MCQKCVIKSKRFHSRTHTYGQIKALAQKFYNYPHIVGLYDHRTNVSVEAHLFKIQKALTNKKFYNRKREVV